MIDFIKIKLDNTEANSLEENSILDFYDNINLSTGEIRTQNKHGNKVTPSKKASYRNLEFTIYDTGTITISGSLHKYFNNGLHNYNDFHSSEFISVVNELKTIYKIQPENCIIKCLEVGVNITPPIPSNEILDNSFLHKTKPFEYQKNSNEGKYKQVEHSQYIIKLYNKGLHYKRAEEILRFEIKYLKMEKLNKMGIYTLQDLTKFNLAKFKNHLLTEWNNVLFYDNTTQIDLLSTKLQKTLLEYCNPVYWSCLAVNSPENFKYHKRQMKTIIKKYSLNIHNTIYNLISKKIDELTSKTTEIDNIIKGSISVVINNKCKVTGIPLEHEKEDAVYIRTSTIKYLKKNDPETYALLCATYIPHTGKTPRFEKNKIKQLSKQIRNKYYNPVSIRNSKKEKHISIQYSFNYGGNC